MALKPTKPSKEASNKRKAALNSEAMQQQAERKPLLAHQRFGH